LQGAAQLLNSIAVGDIARATTFTTPVIRAIDQRWPAKAITHEPTGNDVSSASGGKGLLDWYINRWSASATVELPEQNEDGDISFFPERFEIPFELVDKVELAKDKQTG
jgi:hypothetical protein